MRISDDLSVRDLQVEFQKNFPFLKIEFYPAALSHTRVLSLLQPLNPDKTIGEIRTIHTSGNLLLDGNLTVKAFEQTLADIFGLQVRVFRKSFGQWLSGASSAEWTLNELNMRGMLTEDKLIIQ